MKHRIFTAALAAITLLASCGGHHSYAYAQVNYALMPVPRPQFFDATGVPLASGKLYTYLAGTTTPSATFTTSAGNVQNANPIILNSGGFPASGGNLVGIYFAAHSYKIKLTDANDVLQWTADNVFDSAQLLELALATSITTGTLTADKIHITGTGSWCGNSSSSSNGVLINCDQTFTNPDQSSPTEARGLSMVVRRNQNIYPEGGADEIAIVGATTIEAGTTSGTILGQMKSLVGETYLNHPNSGSYTVNNAFGLQVDVPTLGTGATLVNYYGVISNAPCRHGGGGCFNGDTTFSGGTITNAYSFYSEGIPPGVVTGTRAAFRPNALEDAGRLLWTVGDIRESQDSNSLKSVLVAGAPLQLGRAPINSSGIVNVSGQTVTYVSGINFTTGTTWNGQTLTVNSLPYVVESVTDSTHLTLVYPGAGTQSGVAYSLTTVVDVSFLGLAYQNSAPGVIPHVGRIYPKESDGLLYYRSAAGTEYNLTSGGGGGCSPACWFQATSTTTGNSPSAVAFLGNNSNQDLALVTNTTEQERIQKTGRHLFGLTASTETATASGNLLANGSYGLASAATNANTGYFGLTAYKVYLGTAATGTGINLPLAVQTSAIEGFRMYASNQYGRFNKALDFQSMSAPDVSTAATSTVVNTSSFTATKSSGSAFVTGTAWVGLPFSCSDGNVYEIASVTSATVLVTQQALGTQSGITCTVAATAREYTDGTNLYASIGGAAYFTIGTGGGGGGWNVATSATAGANNPGVDSWIALAGTHSLNLAVNSGTVLTIDSTKRVDIGTTSSFGGNTLLTLNPVANDVGIIVNQTGAGSASIGLAKSGTGGASLAFDGSNFAVSTGTHATAAIVFQTAAAATIAGKIDVNQCWVIGTGSCLGSSAQTIGGLAGKYGQYITTPAASGLNAYTIWQGQGTANAAIYSDGTDMHYTTNGSTTAKMIFGLDGAVTEAIRITPNNGTHVAQTSINGPPSASGDQFTVNQGIGATGASIATNFGGDPFGWQFISNGNVRGNMSIGSTTNGGILQLNNQNFTIATSHYVFEFFDGGVFQPAVVSCAALPTPGASGYATGASCKNVNQDGITAGSVCQFSAAGHTAVAFYQGSSSQWVCF